MRQFNPNPSTPEQIAHRAAMMANINSVSDWIADHGPITDPITHEWVMSQVTPMLADAIEIAAQECANGWWVYSFKYPPFVQPEPDPAPEPEE